MFFSCHSPTARAPQRIQRVVFLFFHFASCMFNYTGSRIDLLIWLKITELSKDVDQLIWLLLGLIKGLLDSSHIQYAIISKC